MTWALSRDSVSYGTALSPEPGPERVLPVYTMDDPECVLAGQMVEAVTTPPVETDNLEKLIHLLPTAWVPTPPPKPVPMELEVLL